MQSDNPGRHFLLAFILAAVGYVVFYSCDRHLRLRKGPWQLTFTAESTGEPALVISQPNLGISNVKIVLEGETYTNRPVNVVFDGPGQSIPFGRIVFFDTTFLPGTVTFDLFGHEVELMPRTLILNFEEQGWKSNSVLRLKPELKLMEKAKQATTPAHEN